jgi:hypothetical protein
MLSYKTVLQAVCRNVKFEWAFKLECFISVLYGVSRPINARGDTAWDSMEAGTHNGQTKEYAETFSTQGDAFSLQLTLSRDTMNGRHCSTHGAIATLHGV